jgi:hypothetical protein
VRPQRLVVDQRFSPPDMTPPSPPADPSPA